MRLGLTGQGALLFMGYLTVANSGCILSVEVLP